MSVDEGSLYRISLEQLAVTREVLLDAVDAELPAGIVYTNYPVLAPVAGHQHLTRLYVSSSQQLEAVVLGMLPAETSLICAQGEDYVPIHDGHILTEQVPPYWAEDAIPRILLEPRPHVEVDGSAVLIARYGLRTWGHWLGELLPKMLCVEAAFPGKHRYVLPATVFSDPVLRSTLESVWYHGIDLARIVPVRPDIIYRFSELYAVSSAWTNHKIHPGAAELMRAHLPPHRADAPRKVAFLRTESRTRNVANAAAVLDELQRQGFTKVEIGALPFADQVAIFAGAELIVSVLGSGLTGLLYAPLGVKILTVAPSSWSDLFFFALMQNRDARLADIRGVQDPTDTRSPALAGFVVEINEICRGLEALAAA